MCMRMQTDDELKVSLLRIRTALFTHVVARCFRKVEATHRDFAHLTTLQVDTKNWVAIELKLQLKC